MQGDQKKGTREKSEVMAKKANPLRIKARNRTHARKKATVMLGRNHRITGVRSPKNSSEKYKVYHKEKSK